MLVPRIPIVPVTKYAMHLLNVRTVNSNAMAILLGLMRHLTSVVSASIVVIVVVERV